MTYTAGVSDVYGLGDEAPMLSAEVRTSSVVAALVVAPTGVILTANAALLTLLGKPSAAVVGKNIQAALLARRPDWKLWETAAGGGPASGVEIPFVALNGQTVLMRGDIRAVTNGRKGCRWLTGVFVDITSTQHLENALHHAARMEAVASLTSGIAHDFSNLLTVLVGNLYLISEGVRDRPPLLEKTKLARDAAKRGIDLIRQLLAFARNEKAESKALDPAKLVENLEPLLARALGSRIKLETNLESSVALLDTNAAQLESVIVNLVINARDAIKATGSIRIDVSSLTVDGRTQTQFGVNPGEYVRIAVTDTGAGIPNDLLDRVFEPFFSTKGEGKGTGLGLAVVRRFADQAGGAALLKSQLGKGTTVSLLLPTSAETTAVTTIKTMPLSTLAGGTETVLVFTEDAGIASTVDQILAVLGYRVILSNDWREALELLRAATVHLVLIDSKGSGDPLPDKLIRAMRHVNSSLRLAVLSASRSPQPTGVGTLLKPFDLGGLATAVRQFIDEKRHAE